MIRANSDAEDYAMFPGNWQSARGTSRIIGKDVLAVTAAKLVENLYTRA